MEREIEVKLLEDVEKVEEVLKTKGEFISEEEQENILIDSSTAPIPEEKGYLRIRKTKDIATGEEKIYFTFKERVESKSVRENLEHTVTVDNVEELINILKLMGFDKVERFKKHRTSYSYKGLRFDIDRWQGWISYVEIEGRSEEEIIDVIKELKLDVNKITTLSIKELKNSVAN